MMMMTLVDGINSRLNAVNALCLCCPEVIGSMFDIGNVLLKIVKMF